MKRFLRPILFGLALLLAVLFGLIMGKGGGISGLWADIQSLFGKQSYKLDPSDPVLKAGLPEPDPLAGLPDGPLNELLKPDLTPEQQTQVVGQMLIDYWTSVRSLPDGGTWEEIREQLAGKNRKELALVPKEHPALATNTFRPKPDAPGIHLHVISSSGCAFQLIYEGPDKLPYTDDDLIRNFPPDLEFK
ncbi:hypothetical protein [Brevifollis gellanilyticus]|uniref:Uncharacterized protein n=1 Tax=Brevifollis gellanilyticus TaxID=748831 RepID=A0A512MAG9_9BACT|nr:hypothetical protein [Brevifollis gellanilyticus]GEP43341.1 hypothetical protein BGE01nite_26320 [Brevifollis gellanilyticus]